MSRWARLLARGLPDVEYIEMYKRLSASEITITRYEEARTNGWSHVYFAKVHPLVAYNRAQDERDLVMPPWANTLLFVCHRPAGVGVALAGCRAQYLTP